MVAPSARPEPDVPWQPKSVAVSWLEEAVAARFAHADIARAAVTSP
jgi:hypothetical protein